MVESLVPHRLLNQKGTKEGGYISKAPGPYRRTHHYRLELVLLSSSRLREIEWRCRSKEAQPVGVYSEVVPAGSSLLTRGLLLGFFNISTSKF